ncbi:MAG: hypothetical protein PHX43_09365 [Alphaproteobacteria bacterium]|nr:hypothetical protein [Alphaproteobacteria bacterium]
MSSSETPTPQQSIAEQAVERLRRFADGNGIDPASIQLLDKNESTYQLTGQLLLAPDCDIQTTHYAGAVRGKKRTVHKSISALREAVMQKKQSFVQSTEWIKDAVDELKNHPGQGWGIENETKITLPKHSEVMAATDKCPACNGQRLLTCQQCMGRKQVVCVPCKGTGREPCPNCFGRGEDPVNPQNPCVVCNGLRTAPCRYCRATGWLPCPTCQGKGGTTCAACNGAGTITEEITITACALPRFNINYDSELPSGLLRALDRLGVANLIKGHASVNMFPPVEDEDNPASRNTLRYSVDIPFADMKVRFNGGKATLISVFGKRKLIFGCPAFLDVSLETSRNMLEKSAAGTLPLDQAIITRALNDALALELSGKNLNLDNGAKELRKQYPIGLSPEVAKEIMRNMGLAIANITRKGRTFAATAMLALSAAMFAGVFLSSMHERILSSFPKEILLLFYALFPILVASLCWIGISQSARLALLRRYPDNQVHLRQKIGKTGYAIIAAVFALYAAVLMIAPIKPWWFPL